MPAWSSQSAAVAALLPRHRPPITAKHRRQATQPPMDWRPRFAPLSEQPLGGRRRTSTQVSSRYCLGGSLRQKLLRSDLCVSKKPHCWLSHLTWLVRVPSSGVRSRLTPTSSFLLVLFFSSSSSLPPASVSVPIPPCLTPDLTDFFVSSLFFLLILLLLLLLPPLLRLLSLFD